MPAQEYISLIDAFLNHELAAEDFAVRFQKALSTDDWLDRPLFLILQDLFEDAEAYDPMWTPEEENVFQITEPTLRREATDARMKLRHSNPPPCADAILSSFPPKHDYISEGTTCRLTGPR